MLDIFKDYQSCLLVAIGAVPGGILRMQLRLKFSQYKKFYFDGLNIVNTIATFLLGFTLAMHSKIIINVTSQQFYLLICVGFLGSLSSFSSLVYESYIYILDNKWFECFVTILLSISLGIISVLIGHYIGSF